jgi:hypothetical protein
MVNAIQPQIGNDGHEDPILSPEEEASKVNLGPKDVEHDSTATASPQNGSIFKRIWTKLGFNGIVFMVMVKPVRLLKLLPFSFNHASLSRYGGGTPYILNNALRSWRD